MMNGNRAFKFSDHLENFAQNQFKAWKMQIFGLTPGNFILLGKVWKLCFSLAEWNEME